MATKGEPVSEMVKQAKDRNEALVAMMMTALDRAATISHQASKYKTAQRELPLHWRRLRNSVNLARTFACRGNDGLQASLVDFCVERSKGPATKLGRLRQRLRQDRGGSGGTGGGDLGD